MKKILLALSLLASAAGFQANAAPAATTTMELDVFGLNCSLCSQEMKTKMKSLVGATDIEPRLECGKIYLELPKGMPLVADRLVATLASNGFTYEGSKVSSRTLAEVRKTAEDQCS